MAGHDELTGLTNRRLFHALAPELLRDDDRSSAVVILDLNGFKPINDTYGHDAGDEVLRMVAKRIVASGIESVDIVPAWGHRWLGWNEPAIAPVGDSVSNSELHRRLACRQAAAIHGDRPQGQHRHRQHQGAHRFPVPAQGRERGHGLREHPPKV